MIGRLGSVPMSRRAPAPGPGGRGGPEDGAAQRRI